MYREKRLKMIYVKSLCKIISYKKYYSVLAIVVKIKMKKIVSFAFSSQKNQ